ncbi:MAG: dihydrolipoyl dehydrogenase [Treponema sp.]|jgi:dihydrolipoamide dehydrogenase|nr:dihydrolipoyl dehydrogenase [Treponema sp.]
MAGKMMYDVIVIGGGPAGYLAAERLGHLGKKVLVVEKNYLGGTCLNVGCIPTKSLLNGAKQYIHAKEAAIFGVHAEKLSVNWNEMLAWKEKTVETLRAGVAAQLKRVKAETLTGTGVLIVDGAKRAVRVGENVYEAGAVLVAAGSVPAMPPIPGASGNPQVLDSTGLLSVKEIPRKLCIIGGGVIGIEFASLFYSLGTEVSVIEMLDEIIPPMDKDHAPLLRRALKGIDFHLGCRVEKIDGGKVFFKTRDGKDASLDTGPEGVILMAVGRRAETASWGAGGAGLDAAAKGVTVDERMRTNISGVWAAGDVNGVSMLAHSAYRMAEIAVADMAAYLEMRNDTARPGLPGPANVWRGNAVPWAVYSLPEAAGAGLTEQEAALRGIAVKKAALPMTVSGRFIAENGVKAAGNVKVLADADNGRILGIHLIGPYASEIIWGAAGLIENEMRVQDVRELIFPHPSVAEVIRDAVWSLGES